MPKRLKFLVLLLSLVSVFILTPQPLATAQEVQQESTESRSLWQDTKSTAYWLLTASYKQFSERNNAYYMAAAIPFSWYSFNIDRKFAAKSKGKKITNLETLAADSSVALSFPLFHLGVWYLGKTQNNPKLMQFAMETAATAYLAFIESGLLSYIQIHHRPSTQNLNYFETSFRGDSSWPSGHVIPLFALTFKTLQFYGPYWALLPGAVGYLVASQRLKDSKHWLSDIAGSFFLTAFASEGVRAVAKYKDNHPVYKWIFEHQAQIGIIQYQEKIGPKIVWQW